MAVEVCRYATRCSLPDQHAAILKLEKIKVDLNILRVRQHMLDSVIVVNHDDLGVHTILITGT